MTRRSEQASVMLGRIIIPIVVALIPGPIFGAEVFDVQQTNGEPAIALIGEITPADADVVNAYLASVPDGTTLWLNSPGGDERSAILIARAVRTNGLTTAVAAEALCNSACTIIFAAGLELRAAGPARFGFHQVTWRPEHYRGEAPANLEAMAVDIGSQAQSLSLLLLHHFNAMGVDASILGYMWSTPPNEVFYPAMVDLLSRQFVTDIDESAPVSDPRVTPQPYAPSWSVSAAE